MRKKDALDFIKFGEYFLYKVSTGILLCIVIIGGFAYYKNEVSPTPMPTYYLSNGDKEIIFQAMSHIGSNNFYQTIQENLREKKKTGYVYYYEGVRPGTDENMDKFNSAIGIEFDKDLYKNFSKLYGVVHQDNSIYLGLENNKDYNIDLSIDEIIKYYENDTSKDLPQNKLMEGMNNSEVIDINSEIIKTLSSLNEKELSILRYINKGILNFMIGSEGTQNLVMNNFTNQKLFSIILDKRNEVLSDKIITSNDKKIFITYGLLHFKGVFDILKKSDNKWKVTKTEFLYPIQ
ncbi:hypothetical protein LR004_02970 [Candidatus Gracilibacteria bacterium]|nr:hypothetical protein [Candidatus Gracilibacteria bacterium]